MSADPQTRNEAEAALRRLQRERADALTDELREAMKSEKFRVGLTFVMSLSDDKPSGYAIQCYINSRKVGPYILPHEQTPLGFAHVFAWLMQVRASEPGTTIPTDDTRTEAWQEGFDAAVSWVEACGRPADTGPPDPPRNPYEES